MNDGQKCFRDLHVAPLRDGGMKISMFPERRIAAPVIGDNGSTWRNGVLDEADQRLGTSVRHHRESDAPGVTPSLSLVEAAGTLALPNFDGTGHEYHVVNATSFASRAATNPSFVGFDDLFRFASDPVLVGTQHASTQLVQYLESGFVTRQTELALELDSRHAGCLADNEVRSPEPDRKRCVGAFHDSARREACISVAMPASQNAKAIGKAVRFSVRTAVFADEPVAPSSELKIRHARSFVRKQSLELGKRVRERLFVSLKYVDNHKIFSWTWTLNILPDVTQRPC